MSKIQMAEEDKKWKAESDARTLSDAHAIHMDAERHKAAQKAAKGLAEEAQDRADGMSKVASGQALGHRQRRIQRKYGEK